MVPLLCLKDLLIDYIANVVGVHYIYLVKFNWSDVLNTRKTKLLELLYHYAVINVFMQWIALTTYRFDIPVQCLNKVWSAVGTLLLMNWSELQVRQW